ncbi:uncharacterized membrane-anchored protein YitT (DUF2179 family) [Oikeobacillus pervagus]|uniref:Uncharacterized membrane-anchored protein YitT (DUF2179 family) n=1 Tax=Oikeobacillus pervagus TaxID=1325931 RepID=A0AAJ1SXH3_9BACI|nr:YitT family protein [Oikeobacillus pervagus]MDQ0214474.1 uncharacterized membrane-anchored protein YitT (DUF2179 family) [Oikeobacillus pervagus]
MTKHTAKAKLIEYFYIVFGSTLVGLSYNIFLLPARLAAGGVSGISTILYDLYKFNPAYVQWLLNIPIFIVGFVLLGKDFSLKTLVGVIFVPFTIWISEDLPFQIDNPLLAAIYGGIVLGVGLGIVYRGKGSTGGLATVGQIVKKYTGLSSGYSQLIVDGLVVVWSAFVFNLELALYAMMAIYVTSKVIDFVQLQSSSSKLVLIITDREERIQAIIKDEIDRGLTKVRSIGGFSNKEKTMILCVVEQQEAIYLKKVLQEEEPTSFVVFLNASEILGRGFSISKFYDKGGIQ